MKKLHRILHEYTVYNVINQNNDDLKKASREYTLSTLVSHEKLLLAPQENFGVNFVKIVQKTAKKSHF